MSGASPSIARHTARVAAVVLAGLGLVAAATVYWGIVAAPSLAARPDNPRRIAFDQRIRRGRILDRRGVVLAESLAPVTPLPGAADGDDGGPDAGPPTRRYPVPAAAPVVGFQTWRYGAGGDPRVPYGAGGAEFAYDDALRGDLGLSWRQLIASRVLHRPQAGHDVVLTLDADLQAFAAGLLGAREGRSWWSMPPRAPSAPWSASRRSTPPGSTWAAPRRTTRDGRCSIGRPRGCTPPGRCGRS